MPFQTQALPGTSASTTSGSSPTSGTTSTGIFAATPAPAAGGSLATPQPTLTGKSSAATSFQERSAPGQTAEQQLRAALRQLTAARVVVTAARRNLAVAKNSESAALRRLNADKRALDVAIAARKAASAALYQQPRNAGLNLALGAARDAEEKAVRKVQARTREWQAKASTRSARQQDLDRVLKQLANMQLVVDKLKGQTPSEIAKRVVSEPVTQQMSAQAAAEEQKAATEEGKADAGVAAASAEAGSVGISVASGEVVADGQVVARADGTGMGMQMSMVAAAAVVGGFILWKVVKG